MSDEVVPNKRLSNYNDRQDLNMSEKLNRIYKEMCNRYTGSESFKRQSRQILR